MKKLLLVFMAVSLAASGLQAQTSIVEAKAKFIYNFTKFFEWSHSESNGDFVIGVLGANDVYQEVKDFTSGKKVINRDIQVERFRAAENVTNCHILFVSGDQTNKLPDLNERLASNTLLISESEKGIDQGAALNFVLEDERLSYEFAPSQAKDKGLKFSSRIQDMASKNY